MNAPGSLLPSALTASSWIERLARVGYAAKGLVYLIMGLLAAAAGIGNRHGQIADRKNAIDFIASMPLGRPLLLVMALGLLGYASWRLINGVADPEQRGTDLKGLALRIGSVVRGLFYGVFAVGIIRFVAHRGGSGKGSDATSRHWAATVMEHPFGRAAIAVAGLSLLGYGIYQFVRAVRGKVDRHLQWSGVPAATKRTLIRICSFGVGARALVFGLIGISLARAALRHQASAAKGTSGALRQIGGLPYGGWLLTVAGLGFAAYGVYAFINARFRRIQAA